MGQQTVQNEYIERLNSWRKFVNRWGQTAEWLREILNSWGSMAVENFWTDVVKQPKKISERMR